jgi:hypothetical protein
VTGNYHAEIDDTRFINEPDFQVFLKTLSTEFVGNPDICVKFFFMCQWGCGRAHPLTDKELKAIEAVAGDKFNDNWSHCYDAGFRPGH